MARSVAVVRVIVVGAGVVGTMHAWHAVNRGHEVVQIERETEARGASLRNFGQIWVSGRAGGEELETALRARELWEEIGARVPALGFRPNGSLTPVRGDLERAVAEAAVARPDAAARGYKLLTPGEARAINPALRGDFDAALYCERDAAVEPRTAQLALRAELLRSPGYTFLPGREVREVVGERAVRDDHGEVHTGDAVVLATGAWLGGLVRELAGPDLPVRRVRLQMMQTDPLGEPLTTSVADADSFRYYPAYASPALDELNARQPQPATAAEHAMQLLMVQRADGGLTIGDTHEYEHPFAFDTVEDPYDHLTGVVESLLGRPLPKIRRRWAGVYAQCTDTSRVVHRQRVRDGVWLVTGPGGRGMTCSPAIAETTANELGW
ncbi:TIGR03364 family FAD-dependent oxidoreductase [Streptomyces rochei]|uniref:TIGR03364 family FAD-dependent oxidoreductase n=2 Tax=Streptomyces rochei group TaxID=2867164 RepID=A0AAX3ZHY8_STRRO|nr:MULTISPECIES: TIGR03364 family FAD-dependent oxidoreductase [Streptomyces]MBD2818145.1 TIGR03364 family FAD-dependent oxidoreductase [Streptomyces parvulus]WDI18611.1 TIGR03364 family FAD-dependent oxidoreductase [Streptomyces enissocaesilis]MBJ6619761.1 TIGR03364 family FAD-dependent oxidoreductase [Streptomyces sp. DHE17-7]MBQ0912023.1 TIGR03364 family FAD-dependent oxidoreductase [Streptomyces sp. RM99]MBU8549961.1 TIGR03364 family FAD-dependent oxidoreductase [Streptomyces sp. Osf17]